MPWALRALLMVALAGSMMALAIIAVRIRSVTLVVVWILLFAALAAWDAWDRRRNLRGERREKGLCMACGYDLTGNVSGVCPECGSERRAGGEEEAER